MILKKNIVDVGNLVLESIKPLSENTLYKLYADEGGMLGTPVFLISNKEQDISYFEYLGEMSRYAIYNYILGRLCTWQIGNDSDYSKKMRVTIEI